MHATIGLASEFASVALSMLMDDMKCMHPGSNNVLKSSSEDLFREYGTIWSRPNSDKMLVNFTLKEAVIAF